MVDNQKEIFQKYMELSNYLESESERIISYTSMEEAVDLIIILYKEFYNDEYLYQENLMALEILVNDFIYNEGNQIILDRSYIMSRLQSQDSNG